MGVLWRYSKTSAPLTVPSVGGPRSPRPVGRRVHAVRKRFRPEVIEQLVTDYQAGRSTTWLMQTHKLGKGTVLSILEEHGVRMRGQGIPEDRVEDVIRLYRSGLSLMRLSHQLDCSAETVRQVLLGAGVTLRKRWDRGLQER